MLRTTNIEASSPLGAPRSAGRSRFSKALPAPPSVDETGEPALSLPPRKDSLPSWSSLPPKDNPIVRKAVPIPSNMATKMMDTPVATAMVPKRKPVGNGASVKSTPSPPPAKQYAGEVSPVESIGSLLSAYGEEDVSDARHSVETAATKYSTTTLEPSPPKVLPKDHLDAGLGKLDLVSPLALPTPVSSHSNAQDHHYQYYQHQQLPQKPPTPPIKDSRRPTTPKSSTKSIAQRVADLTSKKSPPSQANQSPSQPQLLRRRSLKSDKPLTLPELKLTSSHGSTSSSQQVLSSLNNELPELPKPNAPFAAKTRVDSPIRNGFASFPGRNIKPATSQKALPPNPSPAVMDNKPSKESLDGFSQYAQEIESRSLKGGVAKPPQPSPAKTSPEIRRPPTPEYSQHDTPSGQPELVSPASPMTPPEEPRPLSAIREDVSQAPSPAAVAPSATPQPSLLPKTSPRPMGLPSGPAGSKMGLPRSPRVNGGAAVEAKLTGGAPFLTPSPSIQPAPTSPHARSISDTSVPTIEISDDGASTIKAPNSPPRPATSASSQSTIGWRQRQQQPQQQQQQQTQQTHARQLSNTSQGEPATDLSQLAKVPKGEPNYFPMLHYKLPPIAPGTVLTPSSLRPNQLDCFANHYRFVASRNEDHPLACQSCHVQDRSMRFTCAHCGVRICPDCRDVLMMNGRDLNKLVAMLKT